MFGVNNSVHCDCQNELLKVPPQETYQCTEDLGFFIALIESTCLGLCICTLIYERNDTGINGGRTHSVILFTGGVPPKGGLPPKWGGCASKGELCLQGVCL